MTPSKTIKDGKLKYVGKDKVEDFPPYKEAKPNDWDKTLKEMSEPTVKPDFMDDDCDLEGIPPQAKPEESWEDIISNLSKLYNIDPRYIVALKVHVQDAIAKALLAERNRIRERISKYIKECQDKGFEAQTILEHFENKLILEEILHKIN